MGSCSQTCQSKPLSIMKFVTSCAFLLLAVSLSKGLPFPGMIAWVCKSCPNPNMLYTADVLVSQYCRGCTNSLGVSMTGKGDEALSLEEMVGNSVVFFDTKNTNSKLACGEIKNGQQDESA